MVDSKHTNAHVHSVFKIEMSRIARIREKEKSKYEQRNGVKLTYMPFIARAAIVTLRKMRIVNASLDGDSIRYHKSVNLGIAVALDWGLIVPSSCRRKSATSWASRGRLPEVSYSLKRNESLER
jgi:pyruvate dehydrogenase E2 component (dihydrolipoamide acetyltransferase)